MGGRSGGYQIAGRGGRRQKEGRMKINYRPKDDGKKAACLPSVIVTFKGTAAEVRAVAPMKRGDEVLISYIDILELLEMCVLSLDEMGSVFDEANVYMLHMMYQAMGVCLYLGDWAGAIRYGEKVLKPYSVLYPPYSLNVSSMYLKLGRLYMGLEKRSQGLSALKKALAIMEVAHGKDHHYLAELRKEIK
ncbi:hypothetical protein NHX12_026509 [Muraenolepis orangiensis]|uniref:Uncharacterized protein n=1 Tax=Muraenolepis orangiensis TaxID=630683 RepID=A0A9Q0EGR0_9TELE|nr:hypothetical protein NHX12_026509 [Muraenolepis orangiensis]